MREVPGVGFSVGGLDRAKFGFYRFQSFFVHCCHGDIDFTLNCIFDKLHLIFSHWWECSSDWTRINSLLRQLKNIRVWSLKKKMYQNTLKLCTEKRRFALTDCGKE